MDTDKQKELQDRIGAELDLAEQARAAGNEGKARVFARRAAGWAIGLYYSDQSGEPPGHNAVKLLRRFEKDPAPPVRLRAAANRLCTRMTAERVPPFPEDPLEDARQIVLALLDNRTSARGKP